MWRGALKGTRKREDKFQLLGYLYQGHMDWGKYRWVQTCIFAIYTMGYLCSPLGGCMCLCLYLYVHLSYNSGGCLCVDVCSTTTVQFHPFTFCLMLGTKCMNTYKWKLCHAQTQNGNENKFNLQLKNIHWTFHWDDYTTIMLAFVHTHTKRIH